MDRAGILRWRTSIFSFGDAGPLTWRVAAAVAIAAAWTL